MKINRIACIFSVALFFGAREAACQCDMACPDGAVLENDGCGEAIDANGGCNFDPAAFQDLGVVSLGSPKHACGTVGTYGAANRDLDWYQFTLTQPSIVRVTMHHQTVDRVPAPNAIIIVTNGSDCDTFTTALVQESGICPTVGDGIALPAGTHLAIFTVNAFAPDEPACPVDYVGVVEVIEVLPPACASEEGCTEAHGTPGCNNPGCCNEVCDVDSFCCDEAWDQECVDLAVKLCGLFAYDCIKPEPDNDCATSPTTVTCETTNLALSNVGANTDGPVICTDVSADVWYIMQFGEPGGGELQIDVSSPGWDSAITLYDLGASPSFNPADLPSLAIGCIDNQAAGAEAVVLVDAVEGDYYLIQVSGFLGDTGTGTLSISCRALVYNTGNTNPVLFDPTNTGNFVLTNLGLSSGNLSAAQPQRWLAQAFTVPNPGAGFEWNINSIHAYGFAVAGQVNEQLCWRIRKRTGFTVPNPPNDVLPDDPAAASGCVPYPVPTDLAGGAANEDHEIPVNFELAPGDYWLTVFAANATNTPVQNFNWFINSENGIGFTVGGQNGTWRSNMFPTPGFAAYVLPPTQLQSQGGQDPTKLYTAGFRILGTRVGTAIPCPADLEPPGGNGVVDTDDLLVVINSWGKCGPPDDCSADVEPPGGNGVIDTDDLLVIINSWGKCK